MHKRFYILLLMVWAANVLVAQTVVSITDKEVKKPISGGYVVAQNIEQNKVISTSISSKQGLATLSANPPFVLVVSYPGYKVFIDTVNSSQVSVELEFLSLQLEEFVVTSSAVPTKIEDHAQTVKVISAERIKAQGANNLSDVLQNDLNIRISQDNILGAGIQMQGVGGENVKIMLNGVPVIGRLNGNIDLSQINLNQVEKIEIIEGPSSVNYGTNALGGVINLITKNRQQKQITGSLNSYFETVGNYNIDGDLGFQKGKHLIQVSGGRYFFDGFSNSDLTGRFQSWRPKEQVFGAVNYGVGMGRFHLSYNGKVFREIIQSKGTPEAPFYISAFDSYFTTYRIDNSLSFNGYINNNHHLDIVASANLYQRESVNLYKDLVTLNETPLDTNVEEFQLLMSRGIYNYINPNKLINFQLGYEVNLDKANGLRIEKGLQQMEDYALFGNISLGLLKDKKLLLQPGVRLISNSAYSAPITPSFNLKWNAIKKLTLRGSYARGFRAPSLKELYFIFVDVNHNVFGNPNLLAETSNSFNGSIQLKNKFKLVTLEFNISGFYNKIYNQIRSVATSLSVDSVLYRNENIEQFTSKGFRTEFKTNHKRFTTTLGYSYTGILNDLGAALRAENKFVFYPEYQVNLTYKFIDFKSSFNVFFKQFGDQPILFSQFDQETQTDVIEQGIIGGYGRLDLSYNQSLLGNKLNISFFAKNLLNISNVQQTAGISSGVHSSGSSSLPVMWGRSFAVSVKYQIESKK